MSNPREQALKIVSEIKNLKASDEEKFAAAVVLASAGLGIASFLVKTHKVPKIQAASLVFDLRNLLVELESALATN